MSITFIDFFAGIGGFRRGMELAGHKCIGFCEFDKYAVASYTSMHLVTEKQRNKLQEMPIKQRLKEIWEEEYRNGEWYSNDVRSVEARCLPRADCWCFGFPCQDISIAGKQFGFSGRRSSLFFAVTGLIKDLEEKDRPSILFIENVKNLLSVNRGLDFARLLIELDEIGYDAEWCVLNSKDYGVPQNRERTFIVGHFRGRGGREVFPIPEANPIHNTTKTDGEVHKVAQCLTAGGNDKWNGDYIVKQIGNCMPTATRENPNQGRIYDSTGLAPCLNKMEGGGREPLIPISMTRKSFKETQYANTLTAGTLNKTRGNYSPVTGVLVHEATKQGYTVAEPGDSINLEQPNSLTRRGRVGKGKAQTLTTSCNQAVVLDDLEKVKIRKLTPRECFRLQGWTDEYFDRAAMINSDSQLYKQAGNGVTVNVIQAIAERFC